MDSFNKPSRFIQEINEDNIKTEQSDVVKFPVKSSRKIEQNVSDDVDYQQVIKSFMMFLVKVLL